MKHAWKGAIAAAAVMGALLTGCSNPSEPGAGSEPAAWPAQTTKLDGVTLTIWAAQNSNKTPQSVIDGFQKATGAKVNVVTIPTDPTSREYRPRSRPETSLISHSGSPPVPS
jgi:raffinose/stachyose/melibiose transport system substrate-binding protein